MTEQENPEFSLSWLFFSFKGRIARQSYILSIIFMQLLFVLVIYKVVMAGSNQGLLALWGLAFIGLAAIAFWCGLALSVKRLHDLDLPWQLVALQFIPPIMWLFIGFLILAPGKQTPNKHGPPPFAD